MSNHFYDQTFGLHTASDHPFLKTEEGDISHATFAAMTARLSNALVAAGMSVGDRVAVQAEKSPTLLGICAATIRAGGVYLPLNTGYTPTEIDYFVGDARPAIIIVDPAAAADIAPLAERVGAALFTLDAAGEGTLAVAAKDASAAFDTVPRGRDDLAAILYTSGTTGRSKGARLSHHNLVSNAAVLADTWRFTRDDVLLHMLPIYHTHGLFVACNLIAMVGGTMIFLPKFSVETALQWMPQATSMMGVPTFYTRLLASADFTAEASQHMRVFISGSAPLLAETHRAFSARTGKAILERYGMTETNMIIPTPMMETGGQLRWVCRLLVSICALQMPKPVKSAPMARSALSNCVVTMCSRVTGRCRKKPQNPSARTGSLSLAIWRSVMRTAMLALLAAIKT